MEVYIGLGNVFQDNVTDKRVGQASESVTPPTSITHHTFAYNASKPRFSVNFLRGRYSACSLFFR